APPPPRATRGSRAPRRPPPPAPARPGRGVAPAPAVVAAPGEHHHARPVHPRYQPGADRCQPGRGALHQRPGRHAGHERGFGGPDVRDRVRVSHASATTNATLTPPSWVNDTCHRRTPSPRPPSAPVPP